MSGNERDLVAAQFGVPTEQVERDHLISHVVAFLSANVGDQIQLIGAALRSGSDGLAVRATNDRPALADALGMSRATIYRKIKDFGIA